MSMPLTLHRRDLIRLGHGLAVAAGLRGMAFAAQPAPLLVVVNLRGGWDGLHVLSPADDRDFVELRTEALRTTTATGLRLDASRQVDFRLHPDAAPLAALWQAGRLAIWPAAGVPQPTRSHFEAQALLAVGHGARAEGESGPGWLGRWAEAAAPPGRIAALSAEGGLAPMLAGARRGLAVSALDGGLALPGGPLGAAMLGALYADAPGEAALAGREAMAALAMLDGKLARDAEGRALPYRPAGGADYRAAEGFGRALATVAETARLVPGLVAATVDLGGWDTHDGQAGRLAARLRVLAAGLDAFATDLADLPRPWTLLVVSEFGRRLRANRSGGTDHGRAGLMLATAGGAGRRFGLARHFGAWPGLTPEALDEGVDLRVATDYRAVLRAVVAELAPAGPRVGI
jgi:uncharacterized protein (DUF1501 family)